MQSRRDFLTRTAVGSLGLAAFSSFGIEPFERPGKPRLRLSMAAYSFREYFKVANHKREKTAPADKQIDLFQFIDYAADHGCDGVELTSYYFPADCTAEFVAKVRRHAFVRGLSVSGTSIGNTFTHPAGPERDKNVALLKKWVDHAAILGAPHIRVFAGEAPKGAGYDEARKNCLATLAECCDYAGQHGIVLGIENHGGIVAKPDQLLSIVREVKSPWLGINLDTANFHTEDPYADFTRCVPFAVNVQVKDEIRRAGQTKSEPADLKRYFQILRDGNYQGWVALEYESATDPFVAVPPLLKQMKELAG
jgi:sugar phosphate isomerase/epimerase